MQPADLQEYDRSAQKRRRLSFSQIPVTPVKAESIKLTDDLRPDSPTLDLYGVGEDFVADVELQPTTEIKVWPQTFVALLLPAKLLCTDMFDSKRLSPTLCEIGVLLSMAGSHPLCSW